MDMADGDHVLVCVAWPYANGPLHLGHVAGCYLPPDIILGLSVLLEQRTDGIRI